MKVWIFILIFFVSPLFAANLRLEIGSQEIRQGALVKGVLTVDPSLVNVPVPKLKGTSFAETIYFHQLSPLLKKEGSPGFESEVQVIFIKVPEGNSVSGKIENDDVTIEWNPIRIIPVEAAEKMLWADFTAPDFFSRSWAWLWTIPLFILVAFLGYRISHKLKHKKLLRERRRKLAEEIQACKSYDDVVTLWKKKHAYLTEFPQLEEPFRKFEAVLFRYQFKPVQTSLEKDTVLSAYRDLLKESEGGLRGV